MEQQNDKKTEISSGLSAEIIEKLADMAGIGLINMHIPTGEIGLNRTTAQFTGYEPGEIPHSSNTKRLLTYEDDWPAVEHAMTQLMSGAKDRYSIEYRMRRRDGSLVPLAETAVVYERDENGTPVRIGGVGLDLTRLRWAEQKARDMERHNMRIASTLSQGELAAENRMLRAANAAATMVIGGLHQDYEALLRQSLQILGESVQADRAYIWRNKLVDGQLCCYQRAEWTIGQHSIFIAEGQTFPYESFQPLWRQSLERNQPILLQNASFDETLLAFPGMERVLSIMVVPLFLHGEFWGFIGFDDCTAGHAFTPMEAEIMADGALVIASSISRNETYSSLSLAREEAMASVQAKGEFLSRMSHEIRTPMNAIIGMTTIAQGTDDPEKIQYCLDKIGTSSRQLLGIINDVLDMSKIDANKFEIMAEPFDFEQMLQNVISVIQVKLDEKNQSLLLDFTDPCEHMVVADSLRLSQVLINLLTNAVKFTDENGIITLHIKKLPTGDGKAHLHVAVEDTGIGIAPERQKHLFQSFEQADGTITRQYGGTGLGLAISKKIINLMGGEIGVTSTPGEGSTFFFDVDVGLGDPLVSKMPEKTFKGLVRLLVVDDSKEELEYFQAVLSRRGCLCDVVDNGEAALALVKQQDAAGMPYDLIFVDWHMPGMDGCETAQALHKLIGKDTLVVMISGFDWSMIEDEAKASGIEHFLAKPVLPSALWQAIYSLVDHGALAEGKQTQKHSAGTDGVIDWHDKTVLLVDDIEINREIVQSILEPTNIRILSAADGVEAVKAFKANPDGIDAILMDVQMPNMDGLEATRRIRAMSHPAARTVPIIAMTANAFKEDEDHCIAAGMDMHLAKPIDVEKLYGTLTEGFAAQRP